MDLGSIHPTVFHPCWFIYERDELFAPSIRRFRFDSIRNLSRVFVRNEKFSFQFLFSRLAIRCSILLLTPKKESTMTGEFSAPPSIFTISLNQFLINIGRITTRTREFHIYYRYKSPRSSNPRVYRLYNNLYIMIQSDIRIPKITRFLKINHPYFFSPSPKKKKIETR